jgi:hypothetical protein
VRFELNNLLERVLKITTKTYRPIVDEHVRWRLFSGHRGHVREQVMLPEPSANLRVVPGREYDDVETTLGQRAQELMGACTRCVPVIGVLPPGVGVKHAIKIHADNGPLRVFEINFPGLPSHPVHTTISRFTSRLRMTTTDHRKAAEDRLQAFIAQIEALPESAPREAFLRECAALGIAIRAFHMEAIRFRMFNVDRLIARGGVVVSDAARAAFSDVRTELEAAGFHTRSHQAPS